MARRRDRGLFVQDDDSDDDEEVQEHKPVLVAGEAIMIDGDDDDDDLAAGGQQQALGGQQQVQQQPQQPAPQPNQQQTQQPAQPAGQTIDLTEDGPEKYYLAKFNQFVNKDEVYPRLRKKYSNMFKRQARLAMPGTGLRQNMENIFDKVLAVRIGYLIDRDKSAWFQVLKDQRKALQKELDYVEEVYENLKRPDSKRSLRRGLLKEVQGRVNRLEEDFKLREKLIEEMKKFAKVD